MNQATLKLFDACCEAYDLYRTPKDITGDGEIETFCNLAVHYICVKMGYEKFKGLLANQIVDFVSRSFDWTPIQISEAQEAANEGYLVIAGERAEIHGHVVVVRPGQEEISAKWQTKVPKVCHVGQGSFMAKSLAYAFKEQPGVWRLKTLNQFLV